MMRQFVVLHMLYVMLLAISFVRISATNDCANRRADVPSSQKSNKVNTQSLSQESIGWSLPASKESLLIKTHTRLVSGPPKPRMQPWSSSATGSAVSLRGGSSFVPAGWNPWGYKITATGEAFLAFGDSSLCDVGRFLSSLKNRKTRASLKSAWLEIVRHAQTGQAMRIYRKIDDLLQFCLKTGMID